jgi:hypothetical protein
MELIKVNGLAPNKMDFFVEVHVESKTRGRRTTRVSYPPVCRSREQSGKRANPWDRDEGRRTREEAHERNSRQPPAWAARLAARQEILTRRRSTKRSIIRQSCLIPAITPTPRQRRELGARCRIVNGDSLAPAKKGRAPTSTLRRREDYEFAGDARGICLRFSLARDSASSQSYPIQADRGSPG